MEDTIVSTPSKKPWSLESYLVLTTLLSWIVCLLFLLFSHLDNNALLFVTTMFLTYGSVSCLKKWNNKNIARPLVNIVITIAILINITIATLYCLAPSNGLVIVHKNGIIVQVVAPLTQRIMHTPRWWLGERVKLLPTSSSFQLDLNYSPIHSPTMLTVTWQLQTQNIHAGDKLTQLELPYEDFVEQIKKYNTGLTESISNSEAFSLWLNGFSANNNELYRIVDVERSLKAKPKNQN